MASKPAGASKYAVLEQFQVKGDTVVPFKLYAITIEGKIPTLLVRPATEANKPYFNELLKRARSYARQMSANAVTAETLAENRAEDRALYPQHVIAGWEDMPEKFSQEECVDFLSHLPDHIFDDLRVYCGTAGNFVKGPVIDAETAGKN